MMACVAHIVLVAHCCAPAGRAKLACEVHSSQKLDPMQLLATAAGLVSYVSAERIWLSPALRLTPGLAVLLSGAVALACCMLQR
jgi:preprotein translocase subunit Sec61beta